MQWYLRSDLSNRRFRYGTRFVLETFGAPTLNECQDKVHVRNALALGGWMGEEANHARKKELHQVKNKDRKGETFNVCHGE